MHKIKYLTVVPSGLLLSSSVSALSHNFQSSCHLVTNQIEVKVVLGCTSDFFHILYARNAFLHLKNKY
jgi:hypothetical protein